jgi:hypothetical protein
MVVDRRPVADGRPVAERRLAAKSIGAGAGQAERQGEAVAKSRLRFGLADRVGWRRGTDVDAELWPQEAFGGVSDEQFWDDLASDKPLATTARAAQPESRPGQARTRPGERRPGEFRPGDARPGEARPGEARAIDSRREGPRPGDVRPSDRTPMPQPVQAQLTPRPEAQANSAQPVQLTQPVQVPMTPPVQVPAPPPPSQATTQAFAVPAVSAAQSSQGTTQAFQIPGFQPAQGTGPQPAATAQPYPAQPQPPSAAPAQHARPAGGRGRHSAGEDPLTSAAYSLRSGGSVDGRSYQASRRARESRGNDSSTPPYGYPAANRPNWDGNGSTAAYPSSYGQPGQSRHAAPAALNWPGPPAAAPLTQTPPYGESYRHDNGRGAGGDHGSDDSRWGSGAWDYGRPAASGARPGPRGERPAYPGPYDPRGTERR